MLSQWKSALNRLPLTKEIWTFLALTAVSLLTIASYVNLEPQVDHNFFFSSDDPQFQSEERISELFLRNDAQLIMSATGDIRSEEYYQNIEKLTAAIERLGGVLDVKSISNGPRGVQDAINSPLWKRLLISHDFRSTNLIVLLKENTSGQVTRAVEDITEEFSTDGFELNMSGLPYVVELISRYLKRDLTVFITIAFLIFGLIIFVVFRSKRILLGTMVCCACSCIWTIMINDMIGVPIGLLTANLGTVIFVLTLSHLVFLTHNWKQACKEKHDDEAVDRAVDYTFEASFWSMTTTFLGFLSLLLVPAKPLRELGIAGAVGTVVAIMVAYSVYPSFLRSIKKDQMKSAQEPVFQAKLYKFLENHKNNVRMLIIFFCIIMLPGLWKIKTDPSLLSFFSKKSEIYQGLEYIDKNGGSSPLIMVVRLKDGSLLNSQHAYKKLWKLQEGFEQHSSVGSAISLPVLMAEAKEEPLAALLFWDWLLNILEQPQHGEIARSFVTEDRQFGLFMLRMNELNRVKKRIPIINELRAVVDSRDFATEITGGVYKLQGHLAKMVATSLANGLLQLLLFFVVIGWVVSRSWKTTGAMIGSLCVIPIGILGAIGMYRIPLDVVSSPASNVAIAMGIDSMIHLVKGYRRRFKNSAANTEEQWKEVRDEYWQPVLTSMMVVMTGFAIFLFSTFPPTQRFGGAIVFGTLLAGFITLYIMPLIARSFNKKVLSTRSGQTPRP